MVPQSVVEDGTDFRPPQAPQQVHKVTSIQDPLDQLAPAGYLGTREEIEAELDLIAASIRTFHRLQPDQVMRYCAGYTARLTELQVLLHRVESTHRQYKVASRLVEVMRQDLVMIGVQT